MSIDEEAKIQETLQQYDVSVIWDRYNVSGHGNVWIAIIQRIQYYDDDIENLHEGGRDMIMSYDKLRSLSEKDMLFMGLGSPETALASAMTDFRRAHSSLKESPCVY